MTLAHHKINIGSENYMMTIESVYPLCCGSVSLCHRQETEQPATCLLSTLCRICWRVTPSSSLHTTHCSHHHCSTMELVITRTRHPAPAPAPDHAADLARGLGVLQLLLGLLLLLLSCLALRQEQQLQRSGGGLLGCAGSLGKQTIHILIRRRYKVVAEQYCKISPLICMVCLFFKL